MKWHQAMELANSFARRHPRKRYRVEGVRNSRGRWTYWPIEVKR